MLKEYHGVVVPMITPFGKDLKPDVQAIERICTNCGQQGVSILALGTTGESPSVSTPHSRTIVRTVSNLLRGKVKVYACLTGNSLFDNIENARAYMDAGADVIVSILPNYYKLSPEQMKTYYLTLADALDFPMMIYNIPAVTQMSIPLEVVQELSKHPRILGFKDSERDEQRIMKGIEMFRDDPNFSFFVGYAAMSARSLKAGADGIIPSTGNLVPEMFRQMYDAASSGDQDRARHLQKVTDEIAAIYQKDRSLGESLQALKVMMSELGLCESHAIPPLQALDASSQEAVRKATTEAMIKHEIRVFSAY